MHPPTVAVQQYAPSQPEGEHIVELPERKCAFCKCADQLHASLPNSAKDSSKVIKQPISLRDDVPVQLPGTRPSTQL